MAGQEDQYQSNNNDSHKRQRLFIAGCLLFFIVVLFFFLIVRKTSDSCDSDTVGVSDQNPSTGLPQETERLFPRMIDGVMVPQSKASGVPIAVMIDNHPDARPQSGISRASVVYEAEAEGGITRFLAIFDSQEDIEEIGPVRSARPYFIDWSYEYGAMYVHCGGSPDALAKIIKEKTIDLNEFYHSGSFWRDDIRQAPHNVMTSSEKLRNYLAEKQIITPIIQGRSFKDDASGSDRPKVSAAVSVLFPGNFTVDWKYDIINNNYQRTVDSLAQKDKQGDIISAKNVIIPVIPFKIIDDKMRIEMDNVGRGKVTICNDGICKDGFWEKDGAREQTKYTMADGEEFEFNRGNTWVEVIRSQTQIKY